MGVVRKEGDKFNKYLMAVAIYFIIVFYFFKNRQFRKKEVDVNECEKR